MISRVDLAGTRPVTTIEALSRTLATADPRQEAFSRLQQINLNQSIKAVVVSALQDGSHLVKIDEIAAKLSLPVSAKPGDVLNLTLISKEPRLTFSLQQNNTSVSTSFSSAARLLDRLLQAPASQIAPAIKTETPLTETAGTDLQTIAQQGKIPDTNRLANALHNSISSSGVFYESHVAKWAEGRLPLAELLREPQALVGKFFRLDPKSENINEPRQLQINGLIHHQIDVLENQRLVWRGEAWPGQIMQWDVEKEQQRQQHESTALGTTPAEVPWISNVRFELLMLGTVSACIKVSGDKVQMQIGTSSEDTAGLLRQNAALLSDSLANAGSPLDSLLVKKNEEP